MAQVLHGSATTTEAVRRAIQHSQESLRALAKRYGINQKTVAKWKRRTLVTDVPTGPKDVRSTVLSIDEEAIIVAFRRHTLLPLNASSAAPDIKAAIDAGEPFWAHAFEHACARLDIDHRLTKPKHPWTNGQVERMNRTIKDATVKRFYYDIHDQLRTHLGHFVTAYNFARRLKTLKGLTFYEFICKLVTKEPQRFTQNPLHQMPGLNI